MSITKKMTDQSKPWKRRNVEKRVLDDTLTASLRRLYDPMLEEPVPEQFVEILRRAAAGKPPT